jgi:3'(2'), 5'-bisphosphate nucleotidase
MLDKHIIQQLCNIAFEAGEVILTFDRDLSEQMDQQDKVDGTPVTAADLAANKVIEQGIKNLPIDAYPIISEEDPCSVNQIVSDFEFCWLVDPLDGTRGYVRGWDDYTVNIALVENGYPIFGVIVHPAKKTCYWAGAGLGAWKIDQGGVIEQLITPKDRRAPWRILTGCFQNQALWAKHLAPLGALTWQAQNSSLKFCTLSQALADLYPRGANISAWDTAAGQIILEEAGGALVDFNGTRLCYTGPAKSQKGRKDAGFFAFADREHVSPWLDLLKESLQ